MKKMSIHGDSTMFQTIADYALSLVGMKDEDPQTVEKSTKQTQGLLARAQGYLRKTFSSKPAIAYATLLEGASLTDMLIESRRAKSHLRNACCAFEFLLKERGITPASASHFEMNQLIEKVLTQRAQKNFLKMGSTAQKTERQLVSTLIKKLEELDLYHPEDHSLPTEDFYIHLPKAEISDNFKFYQEKLVDGLKKNLFVEREQALETLFLLTYVNHSVFPDIDTMFVNAARLRTHTMKLSECDKSKPVAVFFYPAHIDSLEEGFAFFGPCATVQQEWQIDQFKQTHNVIVRFESSSEAINETIDKIKNAQFNVTDVVLNYHGSPEKIEISHQDNGSTLNFGKSMKDGRIYLFSCNTAMGLKGSGKIAEKISSNNPNQRVYAAAYEISSFDIHHQTSSEKDMNPLVRMTCSNPNKRSSPIVFLNGESE